MLPHSTFEQLGLFIRPGLLTAEQCRAWRQQAANAESRPGRIKRDGKALQDDDARRTQLAHMTDEDNARFDAQVEAVRPELEAHFDMALGPLREYRCLVYGVGDFFVPHYDVEDVEGEAVIDLQRRVVTLLVFLNAPGDREAPYDGGDLAFYGLLDVPDTKQSGFSLKAEQGMLVAFRPDILHGVSPVLSGNRYNLVGWFHEQPSNRVTPHDP